MTYNGAEDLPPLANQIPDPRNLLIDKVGHGPVRLRAADAGGEVPEELLPAGGVPGGPVSGTSSTHNCQQGGETNVTSGWN